MCDAQLQPEAAEFYPMTAQWQAWHAHAAAFHHQQQMAAAAALVAAGAAPHLSRPQKPGNQKTARAMPSATDEEWHQRITKREKEVETIKSLQSYKLYIEALPRELRGKGDPGTPDPRDRSVSKRTWKWSVERWRLELKSRCAYSRELMLRMKEYVARDVPSEADPNTSDASAHAVVKTLSIQVLQPSRA